MPSVITVSTNIFINLWHIVDKTQGVNSCKGTEQGNEIEDLLSLLQKSKLSTLSKNMRFLHQGFVDNDTINISKGY